jgi:hypothetical protein
MKDTKGARFLEALGEIDEKYIEEARYNTMKKKFNFKPIIAVAACAAFALAAIPVANHFAKTPAVQQTEAEKIGVNGKFTAYEVGVMDDGEAPEWMGTHKIELELDRTNEYVKRTELIGDKKTIEFHGKKWETEYVHSLTATDFSGMVDEYKCTLGDQHVFFLLEPVTGEVKSFMITRGEYDESKRLTRDELYEIALKTFSEGGYVNDIENYTLTEEQSKGEKAGYWFRFARVINGIETSDAVRIGLRWNGEIYMIERNHLGEMKNVDLSAIDIEKFYSVIETKLNNIYGEYLISYDKNGIRFKKMLNGEYIFEYNVKVELKNPVTNKAVKDSCLLAITID